MSDHGLADYPHAIIGALTGRQSAPQVLHRLPSAGQEASESADAGKQTAEGRLLSIAFIPRAQHVP